MNKTDHTLMIEQRMRMNLKRPREAAEVVHAALVLSINLNAVKRRKTKAERRLMDAVFAYTEREKQ